METRNSSGVQYFGKFLKAMIKFISGRKIDQSVNEVFISLYTL